MADPGPCTMAVRYGHSRMRIELTAVRRMQLVRSASGRANPQRDTTDTVVVCRNTIGINPALPLGFSAARNILRQLPLQDIGQRLPHRTQDPLARSCPIDCSTRFRCYARQLFETCSPKCDAVFEFHGTRQATSSSRNVKDSRPRKGDVRSKGGASGNSDRLWHARHVRISRISVCGRARRVLPPMSACRFGLAVRHETHADIKETPYRSRGGHVGDGNFHVCRWSTWNSDEIGRVEKINRCWFRRSRHCGTCTGSSGGQVKEVHGKEHGPGSPLWRHTVALTRVTYSIRGRSLLCHKVALCLRPYVRPCRLR